MRYGRSMTFIVYFFFFQAEDGIRDTSVTGVQTCALPIWRRRHGDRMVASVAVRGLRHLLCGALDAEVSRRLRFSRGDGGDPAGRALESSRRRAAGDRHDGTGPDGVAQREQLSEGWVRIAHVADHARRLGLLPWPAPLLRQVSERECAQ